MINKLSRITRSRRFGSALLLILGCVALMTILVISFFASARTEFSTASFYSKGVNTKLLTENVINLVESQLREGARSSDPGTAGSPPVAWVSQPGMIRTYDNSGNPHKFYKLYSADAMVGNLTSPFNWTADSPATGWGMQPNLYTDLNEPITTGAGVADYPIIDPTAFGSVDGFNYTAQAEPGVSNPIPMPVKWLYILKDGTTTTGKAATGSAVTIPGSGPNNPVVGRVAFWTDDETCKVNINTASEGTFWDTPIGQGSSEEGIPGSTMPPFAYATSIPAQFEFQRVPGHPATTSLSTIFGYGTAPIIPPNGLETSVSWPLNDASYGTYFAPYYSLTPRLQAGGSMGGAEASTSTFTAAGYRLYDSVDELVFDPSRKPIFGAANTALYPTANPAGRAQVLITPTIMNQRRFFLTAHSRAPEETLFGTPRVSLWPLQADTAARTAKDNLLAFCTTLNVGVNGTTIPEPYYFQRATWFQSQANSSAGASQNAYPSSQSPTADFPDPPNSSLANPGLGNVVRNENLYAYLQALTGAPVPGFGGGALGYLSKYPGGPDYSGTPVSDRDEILTEMFDLIRSGVNTFDVSPNVYPHYTATPFAANGGAMPNVGTGSTIPISLSNHTHGLGRTYGISEVSLVFMCAGVDINNRNPPVAAGALDPNNPTFYSSPILEPDGVTIIPAKIRRMSIGQGLPWACEEDYVAPNNTQLFLYFDTATALYGTYFFSSKDNANYIYPAATPPKVLPATAIPIPIFCYWDTSSSTYGSYFCAPSQAPNAGTLFTCPSPPAVPTPPTPLVPLPSTACTIADPQTTAVQAFLLIKPYSLMVGAPAFTPNIRYRISHLDALNITFPTMAGVSTSPSLNFPAVGNAVAVCNIPGNNGSIYSYTGESTADGGLLAINAPGELAGQPPTTQPPWPNDGTSQSNFNYPFASTIVTLPAPGLLGPSPAYPSPFGGEDPAPSYTPNSGSPVIPSTAKQPPVPVQIHNAAVPYLTGTEPHGVVYAGGTMALNGTTLQIDILDGVNSNDSTPHTPNVLQTVYVTIPQMTLPIPTLEMENEGTAMGLQNSNNQYGPRIPGYGNGGTPKPLVKSYTNPFYPFQTTVGPSYYVPMDYYSQEPYDVTNICNRFGNGPSPVELTTLIARGDVVRSFDVNPNSPVGGDMRLLGANPIQNANTASGGPYDVFIPLGKARLADATYTNLPTQGPYTSLFIKQLHSLMTDSGGGRFGLNLVQTSEEILVGAPTGSPPTIASPIGSDGSGGAVYIGDNGGGAGMQETSGSLYIDPNGKYEHYPIALAPEVTPELEGAFMDPLTKKIPGDWTLGPGADGDGAYISKPDEGEQVAPVSTNYYGICYYTTNMGNIDFSTTNISYSPNRQVPSGVIFGSLPSRPFGGLTTTASGGVPWCTLLFCPNPAANDAAQIHPGFGAGSGLPGPNDYAPYAVLPDHLFLDLFWMPVVEPYALSEPFSTAGKVNLNYEIVPFGNYIHRSTALHAVMKSTRILAIPTVANDGNYTEPSATKPGNGGTPSVKNTGHLNYLSGKPYDYTYRYGINLPATIDDFPSTSAAAQLNAFYQRFVVQDDLFRSASEICNIFLVPKAIPQSNSGSSYYNLNPLPALPTDGSYTSMSSWWKNFQQTGDNGREGPYSQLYPRLTTKSNTFQVYMRVQVLTQTQADRLNGTFDTTKGDSVAGEYRGSAIIERYLDQSQTVPNPLPDFATTFPASPTAANATVDNYVRYRVLSNHAFSPN